MTPRTGTPTPQPTGPLPPAEDAGRRWHDLAWRSGLASSGAELSHRQLGQWSTLLGPPADVAVGALVVVETGTL
jgi:hypothetical protein